MNKQTVLFGLLFLVALAAWQLGEIELAPEPTTKVENFQPDFTAKHLVTTRFNEQGKRTERLCRELSAATHYIADGHHRYETALNYRNWCRETGKAKEGDAVDYQMMMLVEMEHPGGKLFGVGVNENIVTASLAAVYDAGSIFGGDNLRLGGGPQIPQSI